MWVSEEDDSLFPWVKEMIHGNQKGTTLKRKYGCNQFGDLEKISEEEAGKNERKIEMGKHWWHGVLGERTDNLRRSSNEKEAKR
ncbi:hypothetical protein L1887_05509 [Cichorium endivia]|nr:hypothetical protein L1887_05509 [Cichorium endivia]